MTESERIKIETEFNSLKDLNNKYIVKYFDLIEKEFDQVIYYCLITPYYEGPAITLADLLKNKNQPVDIKMLSKQLLLGIEYLHSKNIFHREIKPSKIFLNGQNLVIASFSNILKVATSAAIWLYNAPEINEKKVFTSKIDIWSFGCVLFEMIQNYIENEVQVTSNNFEDDLNVLVASLLNTETSDKDFYVKILKK